MPEQSKLYTIGEAVAILREAFPDVTHSSLRFLQREGLIKPVRTPGGHRLFRASDIERIRRIKTWQAERLSLAEIRERLERLASLPSSHALCHRFLDLALLGHGPSAVQEVLIANAAGMPLERIYDEVLRPALYEVGDRWHDDNLGVDQEHEITELVREAITELTARHVSERSEGITAVAACVEGDQHDIGLRMVTSVLRTRGAEVHFLGPSVPPEFLVAMVHRREPATVLLSATRADHWPSVRATIEALRGAAVGAAAPRIIVGGQGCVAGDDAMVAAGITVLGAGELDDVVAEILRPSAA